MFIKSKNIFFYFIKWIILKYPCKFYLVIVSGMRVERCFLTRDKKKFKWSTKNFDYLYVEIITMLISETLNMNIYGYAICNKTVIEEKMLKNKANFNKEQFVKN